MWAIFVRGLRFALCSRGCPVTNLAFPSHFAANRRRSLPHRRRGRRTECTTARPTPADLPFVRCSPSRRLARFSFWRRCVRFRFVVGFIYSCRRRRRREAGGCCGLRTDGRTDGRRRQRLGLLANIPTNQPTRRARGRESLWEVQYDENWGKVSSAPILLDTSAVMPLHWLFRQSCNARNATLFLFLIVTVQVMN